MSLAETETAFLSLSSKEKSLDCYTALFHCKLSSSQFFKLWFAVKFDIYPQPIQLHPQPIQHIQINNLLKLPLKFISAKYQFDHEAETGTYFKPMSKIWTTLERALINLVKYCESTFNQGKIRFAALTFNLKIRVWSISPSSKKKIWKILKFFFKQFISR